MTMSSSKAREAPGNTEDPFYVGFGMSVYQSSGEGSPTNWGEHESKRGKIAGGDKCGRSCNFWELYDEDIERAASFGTNCFRFTFEWDRLQPDGPGTALNAAAVARYHQILDSLQKRGLEPFVTLYQFVHPLWFSKMGSFMDERNISVYVDYATAAFAEFGSRIRFWTTFNEANVSSSAGYLYGVHPPGKLARFFQHGRHQLNMLRAHTAAYDEIKAMPGGDKAQVGLVHNWFTFEPQQGGCCTPFYMRWVAALANRLWANDVVVNYLRTGVYDYAPLPWPLSGTHFVEPRPKGKKRLDFWGLNYYSRGVFNWALMPAKNKGEVFTDMPYALWAEGLLEALDGVACLEVPVYITETGCADAGDEVRPVMIESYMGEVEKAVGKGVDLRGVFYWCLVDNFEWADGFGKKFGIYEFDAKTQERKMKPSGALLRRWFARLKESCPRLRAAAAAGDTTPAVAANGLNGIKEAEVEEKVLVATA